MKNISIKVRKATHFARGNFREIPVKTWKDLETNVVLVSKLYHAQDWDPELRTLGGSTGQPPRVKMKSFHSNLAGRYTAFYSGYSQFWLWDSNNPHHIVLNTVWWNGEKFEQINMTYYHSSVIPNDQKYLDIIAGAFTSADKYQLFHLGEDFNLLPNMLVKTIKNQPLPLG